MVPEVAESIPAETKGGRAYEAGISATCRPLDVLAPLLKTHRMETDEADCRSSSRPESGRSVDCTECAHPARMSRFSGRSNYPQTNPGHSVTVVGDIVGPVIPEEHWESLGP